MLEARDSLDVIREQEAGKDRNTRAKPRRKASPRKQIRGRLALDDTVDE